MLRGFHYFLIITGVLVLFMTIISCERNLKFTNASDLRDFIYKEENGLTKIRENNSYSFKVSYLPTDILVNRDLNASLNKSLKIDSLRKKYKEYYYFQLSISRDGHAIDQKLKGGLRQYRLLKENLIYGLSNQIVISTKSSDSIRITDYIYPRLYGLNHATNILFFFRREDVLKKDKILTVNIKDVGIRNRKLRFPFDTEKLQRNMEIEFN